MSIERVESVFKHFLAAHAYTASKKWLVAASGGLDSMVLIDLCRRFELNFEVAHVNYRLRAAESQRDEDFIRVYCVQHQIPFHVRRVDETTWTSKEGKSTQLAAREIRYEWFNSLMAEDPTLVFLATAHQANDQAETLLMNLGRGTGLMGMKGMLGVQGTHLRPLLAATRPELESYATAKGLKWVEDSSNLTDAYTRNKIRHQVLPALESMYPSFVQMQVDNSLRLQEATWLYQRSLDQIFNRFVRKVGQEWHISVKGLKHSPVAATLVHHFSHPYGFSYGQIPDILQLCDSDNSKWVQSETHRIFKNRAWLVLAPLQAAEARHILLTEPIGQVVLPDGVLQWRLVQGVDFLQTKPHQALLNADQLSFPLLLRRPTKGDYFYPLGMRKKKKISRFFVDQKLSLTEKEKSWLLMQVEKVIWVVGRRIDDRFKCEDRNRPQYLFEWLPNPEE